MWAIEIKKNVIPDNLVFCHLWFTHLLNLFGVFVVELIEKNTQHSFFCFFSFRMLFCHSICVFPGFPIRNISLQNLWWIHDVMATQVINGFCWKLNEMDINWKIYSKPENYFNLLKIVEQLVHFQHFIFVEI